jgi:hypothetical protein
MSGQQDMDRLVDSILGVGEESEASRMIREILEQQESRAAARLAEERASNPFYPQQAAALQQLIAAIATHGELAVPTGDDPVEPHVPGFKITGVRTEDEPDWSGLYGRALPGGARTMVYLNSRRDRQDRSQLESVILTVDTYDWEPSGAAEVMDNPQDMCPVNCVYAQNACSGRLPTPRCWHTCLRAHQSSPAPARPRLPCRLPCVSTWPLISRRA